MKRLLLTKTLLLPIFLASCSSNKYSSFSEAEKACNDWYSDAKFYRLTDSHHNRPKFFEGSLFWRPKYCEHDKETRQFIGWKIIYRYIPPQDPRRANGERSLHYEQMVEKRFYY